MSAPQTPTEATPAATVPAESNTTAGAGIGDPAASEAPPIGVRRSRAPRFVAANPVLAACWTTVIAVLGAVVVLAGVVMIATPGPAFVVIPAGLAIWATEFEFAHRWLHRARQAASDAADKAKAKREARRSRRGR